MAATIQSRIDRGVKLLDEKAPGWVYKVRISDLDVSDAARCVLGQVFDDYVDGLDALGLRSEGGARYGFDWSSSYRQFPVLTERWKSVIRERRGNSGTRGRK